MEMEEIRRFALIGCCKSSPPMLGIMDSVVLSIRRPLFQLRSQFFNTPPPLPTLFKKAEFTPGDLYTRKRPLNSEF
ncbi:DNA repair protein RAD5A-like [Salvia hispanica]|uniref:DNA repair protein RAD5A-like n=1 Tax=Salvia hispanica TaxID=49212 RepID=UPI002008F744|nr:DNA repair protein RAD5A-like [Salvia hispanica]